MPEPEPERVDQLLGRALPVPHGGLAACALTAVGALVALAVALVLLPADPALPLALLPGLAAPALLPLRSAQ
jgi:hypothetical protein